MRPEHRHELKTNELAQWLAELPQWATKNLRIIIYVSIVVVLVGGSYIYHRYQKDVVAASEQNQLTRLVASLPQNKMRILQAQSQGADISYMLMQSANELETLAKNSGSDAIAAVALIKQAETLRAELHYRSGKIEQQDVAGQMNRAKEIYNSALQKCQDIPSLAAMAKLGVALCEEELGNFDAAKQICQEIAAGPQYAGTAGAAAAAHRLKTMDYYKTDLAFKPSPAGPAAEPLPQVNPIEPSAQTPPQAPALEAAPSTPQGAPDTGEGNQPAK